ncbi:MAG TPA: hypothetical protein VGB85_10495, partial [Nannocystis sp.]
MRTNHALKTFVIGALVLTGCPKDGEDTGATTKTTNQSGGAEAGESESTTGASAGTTTGATAPVTTTDPNPTTDVSVTEAQTSAPMTTASDDSTGCSFLGCDSSGGGPVDN